MDNLQSENQDHLLVLTDDEFTLLCGAIAAWVQAVDLSIPLNKRHIVESLLDKLGVKREPVSRIQVVRS